MRPPNAWSPRDWPSEGPPSESDEAAYCYTDRFSYLPGERITLHGISTIDNYRITVIRDGLDPEPVWTSENLPASYAETPEDCFASGCDWPEVARIETSETWRSGFYLVVVSGALSDGTSWEREHFFVLRSPRSKRDVPFALILTTSTVLSYNDWGGANLYRGLGNDPRDDKATPLSALKRPIGRGMLRKPAGAPREGHRGHLPIGFTPTYRAYEWARLNQYCRHHADAGWATYERNFVTWAERHGYELHYLTQHDLDQDSECLSGYNCGVIVGHDEYWSWRMRDTVDAFVEAGGNLVRFGGNYEWQVRLEQEGDVQACYRLPALDPKASETPHLATTIWEAKSVSRPGALTMGLNGSGGIYNRYGAATPRSSGGYTIYRPTHWSFEGTDLYYGDELGPIPVGITAFEVDSVEYTFHRGVPYPTHEDGAPDNLEILGLCPAVLGEEDRWAGTVPIGGTIEDFGGTTIVGLGDDAPEWLRDRETGAGMIACFEKGNGTVYNTGTTEWVVGLMARDPFIERITHNVLRRLGHLE